VIGSVGIIHIGPPTKLREGKYGYFRGSFGREFGKERFKRSIKIPKQFRMRGSLVGVCIKSTKAGRKYPHPKVGVDQVCRHQQLTLQP
jgi:hypothetical protein